MYKVWKHLCCWHFMWGWHEPWHNNCQNVCWQNLLKFLVNFYFYLGIVIKLFILFVKSYKNTIFLHTFLFNLELKTKSFSLIQVHVYSIFFYLAHVLYYITDHILYYWCWKPTLNYFLICSWGFLNLYPGTKFNVQMWRVIRQMSVLLEVMGSGSVGGYG